MAEDAEKLSEPAVARAKASKASTPNVGKIGMESLPHLASVVAPAALAVGALLYLAGHVNRVARLRPFGVDGMVPSASFQATMANGFFPLLIGTVAIVAVGSVLWKLDRWAQQSFDYIAELRQSELRWTLRAMAWVNAANRRSMHVFGAVLLLSYAHLSGAGIGALDANLIKKTVDRGCKTGCLWFTAGNSRYLGVLLAQDTNRTVLYTRRGVVALDTKEIKLIVPHRWENDRPLFLAL